MLNFFQKSSEEKKVFTGRSLRSAVVEEPKLAENQKIRTSKSAFSHTQVPSRTPNRE